MAGRVHSPLFGAQESRSAFKKERQNLSSSKSLGTVSYLSRKSYSYRFIDIHWDTVSQLTPSVVVSHLSQPEDILRPLPFLSSTQLPILLPIRPTICKSFPRPSQSTNIQHIIPPDKTIAILPLQLSIDILLRLLKRNIHIPVQTRQQSYRQFPSSHPPEPPARWRRDVILWIAKGDNAKGLAKGR